MPISCFSVKNTPKRGFDISFFMERKRKVDIWLQMHLENGLIPDKYIVRIKKFGAEKIGRVLRLIKYSLGLI